MHLEGKNVLITGGARGLGKAFAEATLEAGGKVILADVRVTTGLDTAAQFNTKYGSGSTLFIKCDVTNKEQLERTFQKAISAYGHLDIVVNNAGIVDHENFEVIIDIDLTAVIQGCFLAAEHMRKDKGGKGGLIVNISSTAGLTSVPSEAVYSGAKHGVVGFSRSFGDGMVDYGVKVLCLCPSYTKTERVLNNLRSSDNFKGTHMKIDMKSINSVGFMEESDVVAAFRALVQDEHAGSVLAVTPKGLDYRFPRRLKKAKL